MTVSTCEALSTLDVACVAGLSVQRIDRYARLGMFGSAHTPGSGHRREFTWCDVFVALVLKQLTDLRSVFGGSVPLGLAGAVAKVLRDQACHPDGGAYLCVIGSRVVVADEPVDGPAVLVVSLGEPRRIMEQARIEFEG